MYTCIVLHKTYYNLATRYVLLKAIISARNNIFHIRIYAVYSAQIWKHKQYIYLYINTYI